MEKTKHSYIEAVGRRKSAVARVRITPSPKGELMVNGAHASEYFKTEELRTIVGDPFKTTAIPQKFQVSAKVSGGGVHSQAEAVRHGLSRALTLYDRELRGRLKKAGFLKRDPRKKERKKFGLKKARKAPTWSKR